MLLIKIIRNILNLLDSFRQKKIIKVIKKKINNSPIIIDVGAHFGESIKIFTKSFKIKKIYSFEASPENFEVLKRNYPLSKESNIEIYNYGIGGQISNDFINQTLESSSSTINDLNKESDYFFKKLKILNIKNEKFFSKKIPIQIITLDSFFEKKQIDSIDLLKIDTEGYEYNVLKGLFKYHDKIKLIYFEHHYDNMILKNYKFRDINNLLTQYGFKKILKNKMLFRKSFEYLYENKLI